MLITLSKCRTALTITWFIGVGLIFLVKFLLAARFGESNQEAWSWLVPNVIPSLSLVTSVFVLDAMNPLSETKLIGRSVLVLGMTLSIAYLLIIVGTLSAVLFTTKAPIDVLRSSNAPIGALQGIAVVVLSAIFHKSANA